MLVSRKVQHAAELGCSEKALSIGPSLRDSRQGMLLTVSLLNGRLNSDSRRCCQVEMTGFVRIPSVAASRSLAPERGGGIAGARAPGKGSLRSDSVIPANVVEQSTQPLAARRVNQGDVGNVPGKVGSEVWPALTVL